MDEPKFYEWTVKIRVSANWVADGFDLTAERLHAMVNNDLQWAHDHEIEAEVILAPPADDIAREQGYKDAAAQKAAR